MNTLRLALRLLARDGRAGELRVLVAALVLAVASVGTVGMFADRVKGALAEQANLLLGGDLMISGDRPLPARYEDEARARKLQVTPVIRFNSMVQLADPASTNAVLSDVKAIAQGYPLRGAIMLVDPASPDGRPASGIPGRGQTWIDARLADRLGARIGSKLAVGEATLTVTALIQQEPEIAGLTLAPASRLLLNKDDLPATNLLQPGNRATWRLLVAAPRGTSIDGYSRWLSTQLAAGQRVDTVRDLRPEVRQTLERADKYLGLTSLVAVLLAAVAVALAASRYLRRHLDAAAMLRCFGAPMSQTLALFVLQFATLGIVASALGLVVAWICQQALVALLASVFASDLPPSAAAPAVGALATGILLLFGFALPPLIALAKVEPLRVLRRDLPRPRAGGVVAYACGAVTVALLIGWQAREAEAAAIMIGGIAGLLAASALIAWGLLAALKRLPQRGVSWRFGLANLRRRALASSLQIGALSMGIMALLLLTVVRGDLMRDWRASLPADAPNYFLINVLPDQVDDSRSLLRSAIGVAPEFRPMVRGRLVEVNGKPLDTSRYTEVRARRLAEREFNLSWADTLANGNRITAGRFWDASARGTSPGMSLEDRIADTLGVKLGDALTFDIAGSRITAQITSLRKVDWDSFRVNFFALFPPGALDGMPTTYISAFRAPPAQSGWLSALLQRYPNVLAIDVGEILHQIQTMMERVARAIEFVFLFTLAGGLLVLQAAIASTQDERKLDAAVLRTLGASRRQLRAAQLAEF
ncbi:MAG TPA: FtsX-like permease family protein, partial [Casimicrobiaceae bacterium]|nr:FtsX-like permease family protein [Casimicrobiaceae bacterium]